MECVYGTLQKFPPFPHFHMLTANSDFNYFPPGKLRIFACHPDSKEEQKEEKDVDWSLSPSLSR